MAYTVTKLCLLMLCELIILSRHNCHLLINNGFESLCGVCYRNFLVIVFVESIHDKALISCGARCYFSKLQISVVFSTVFLIKIENHNFSIFFSFSVPKMSYFLRMVHKRKPTLTIYMELKIYIDKQKSHNGHFKKASDYLWCQIAYDIYRSKMDFMRDLLFLTGIYSMQD